MISFSFNYFQYGLVKGENLLLKLCFISLTVIIHTFVRITLILFSLKKNQLTEDSNYLHFKHFFVVSSADLLNNELKNKISSERPLSPTPNRINCKCYDCFTSPVRALVIFVTIFSTKCVFLMSLVFLAQESAIILSKQSTASEVQNWMKSKNFSPE